MVLIAADLETCDRLGAVSFAVSATSTGNTQVLDVPKSRTRRSGAVHRRGLFGSIKSIFDDVTDAVGSTATTVVGAVKGVVDDVEDAVDGPSRTGPSATYALLTECTQT